LRFGGKRAVSDYNDQLPTNNTNETGFLSRYTGFPPRIIWIKVQTNWNLPGAAVAHMVGGPWPMAALKLMSSH
jgi:hypothetical protein